MKTKVHFGLIVLKTVIIYFSSYIRDFDKYDPTM
jgi:hypothetical protein